MTRKLSVLLIAVFLSVQIFSLWHMANRGFEPHKHDGYTCKISLFFNHCNASDVPARISVPLSTSCIIVTLVIFSSTLRPYRRHHSGEPRAPPVFSL